MFSFNDSFAAPPFAASASGQQWQGEGAGASGRAMGMDTAVSPFSDGSLQSDAWPISPDSSNDSHHGSSPEGDPATTSARPAKSGRTPSRYDWTKHMPTIKKLYIDEDKTLKEVLEIMQRNHNFIATPRMVKTRLKKWGYSKNVSVKSEEVESLMGLIFDAESHGDVRRTSTEVTLATGRKVGLDRVAAHLRRKRIPANIVQKASQLCVARYYGSGPPSPNSLLLDSPFEFRIPERIFADVQSYVYFGSQRPDAVKMIYTGDARENGDAVGIVSSARKFFVQKKDAEALALLQKAPSKLKELLESDDPAIPRHIFRILIHLLNVPDAQRLHNTVRALLRYIAQLSSEDSLNWPENHPLRRILFYLDRAGDESLLELVVRGYMCLLESYESSPGRTARGSTAPAWLDLGDAAGFASLPLDYLETSLRKTYNESLLPHNLEESQIHPFQHLSWMAELERQTVKARGSSTSRLKELYGETLRACEGNESATAVNARLNCHYYLAGIYHEEGVQDLAKSHMISTMQCCDQLGFHAHVASMMAELQNWHREWGETDKVAAMQEEIVAQMSNLGLEANTELSE